MDNRVYYGEYSLAYWIELLLTKKLILPKYQRHFVWSEERLESLIDSFKDNRFVPPVTIGYFKKDNNSVNYIIDGQQRLTSILLAYLGKFPNREAYKAQLKALAGGDDEQIDEDEDPFEDVLKWNLEKLTQKGASRDSILKTLSPDAYKDLNTKEDFDDDFWNTTFMGFSYIVPGNESTAEQQKYYTKVFREINRQGVNLLVTESRKSLYFLNEDLEQFFEPTFVKDFKVTLVAEEQQMDYVRYLSLLSAYKKSQKANDVGRGYSRNMEQYYENYIYAVVNDTANDEFEPFETTFPDGNYTDDLSRLTKTIIKLNMAEIEYKSIIDLDIYFFGLIYHILFNHKTLETDKEVDLKNDIDRAITRLKAEKGHSQAPAKFKFLRERIVESINIYKKYLLP
jgi:hypothetical protein